MRTKRSITRLVTIELESWLIKRCTYGALCDLRNRRWRGNRIGMNRRYRHRRRLDRRRRASRWARSRRTRSSDRTGSNRRRGRLFPGNRSPHPALQLLQVINETASIFIPRMNKSGHIQIVKNRPEWKDCHEIVASISAEITWKKGQAGEEDGENEFAHFEREISVKERGDVTRALQVADVQSVAATVVTPCVVYRQNKWPTLSDFSTSDGFLYAPSVGKREKQKQMKNGAIPTNLIDPLANSWIEIQVRRFRYNLPLDFTIFSIRFRCDLFCFWVVSWLHSLTEIWGIRMYYYYLFFLNILPWWFVIYQSIFGYGLSYI